MSIPPAIFRIKLGLGYRHLAQYLKNKNGFVMTTEKQETIIIVIITLCAFILGFITNGLYNEPLQKYRPIEKVIQETSSHTYDHDNYNCVDFSKNGQLLLETQGIGSTIIIGRSPDKKDNHAFLGVWIDFQTGEFVGKEYDFLQSYYK